MKRALNRPAPKRDKLPPRNALLLVNGNARHGATPLDKVEDVLEAHGIGCVRIRLRKGQDASALIDSHAGNIDRVIVAGGDGTLNATARGLISSGLPLGILPLGTANDLARTLGIPQDLAQAAEVIAQGRTRVIDVGEVNGIPFFNVASVGFSAELARRLTQQAKRRWGVLGYAMTAARLLWDSKPFAAALYHHGREERVRTLQVAVGNGEYYGGGMRVAEHARPDNGILDIYSLEVGHWLELPLMLPMLRSGTHTAWPTVRGLRVAQLELRTARAMPVNADGEIVTRTPATFKVRERAVKVFVAKPS